MHRLREEKSAPYRNLSYGTLLEEKGGSYMNEHELASVSVRFYLRMDRSPRMIPYFATTFSTKLAGNCKARTKQGLFKTYLDSSFHICRDTGDTLVPNHLDIMVESVNEGWNNSIPVTKPRPQPDYALQREGSRHQARQSKG